MKTSLFTLFALLMMACGPENAARAAGPSGQEIYYKGCAALERGDLAMARKCFEQLLRAKPDFELAKFRLAEVAVAERELAKIPRSLKVARKEVAQRMEVGEASLDEAVQLAARELERAGGGPDKITVNVAGHLPEAIRHRQIALSASQAGLDGILAAIGFAGGIHISYTADGIAVKPETGETGKWDAGNPSAPGMEAAAKKLIIARIVMQEATLAEAIDFLKRKAVELSGGQLRPIFAIRYDMAPRGMVSLDLRNVSLADALHAVCIMADSEEKWFPWGAGIGNVQAAAAVAEAGGKSGAEK